MKILLISNIFPPGFIGGYELGALDVARGLSSFGHDVVVLTSDYFLDDDEVIKDMLVERTLVCNLWTHELSVASLHEHAYYNFKNVRTVGSCIRRHRPDAVLTFNLHGLGVLSLLSYLHAVELPLVMYLMDDIFSGINNDSPYHAAYERIVGPVKVADHTEVIAMSSNLVREVERTANVILNNLTILPGWASEVVKTDRPSSNGHSVAKFVFCSRIAQHKGIFLVIDAVEELVAADSNNFSVDLYGAGQVSSVVQLLNSKGLEGVVSYKGLIEKENIPDVLSGYDALLFPTWEREAFGFVASEAAMVGCLPIITAGIGAGEWFLDGIDALKIERSVESLRTAMMTVITMSDVEKTERREIVQSAARRNFSFDRCLAEIIDVIRSATSRTSPKLSSSDLKGVESSLLYLNTLFAENVR